MPVLLSSPPDKGGWGVDVVRQKLGAVREPGVIGESGVLGVGFTRDGSHGLLSTQFNQPNNHPDLRNHRTNDPARQS